jgi:hypothetical protein
MCAGGSGSIGVVGDAPEVFLHLEGARLEAAAIAELLLLSVAVDGQQALVLGRIDRRHGGGGGGG